MAIRNFSCTKCTFIDLFFDHQIRDSKAICTKCGNTTFNKLLSVPSDNKVTESTKDYYTGALKEKGIEEDLRKRTTKHVNDTLPEMIEELKERFGEKEATNMAKEQGWLRTDDNGKTWRLRTDFDTGTLHAHNSGSLKASIKGKK